MSDTDEMRKDIWAHAAADFPRIEAEAAAEWRARLAVDEATPLEWGAHIVWSVKTPRNGITDGMSDVHRVGYPIGDNPATTCGEMIPPAVLWVPLSPAMVRAAEVRVPTKDTEEDKMHLMACRFCKAEHARQLQERVA